MRDCAVKGHQAGVCQVARADAVALLGQHDDRPTLRRLVGEARQLRHRRQPVLGHPRQRQELGRLPVAEGDGAGLVEQQRRAVPRGLDRTARHREHVVLHEPVHPGDADGGQQRADRGGDETDQQGDQHDHGLLGTRIDGEGLQGRGRQQEDDREAGQQDVERDLVGCLLPAGALDQGDHPIEEGLAGAGGDAHEDLVGQHLGAAGDRRAVAAGLPDDRGGLARDGRLVDRGDARDDLAVGGIISPALTTTTSSTPSPDEGTVSSDPSASRRLAMVSDRALRSVSACALPRPSATASAKLANRTVNHSQAATRPPKRFSLPLASPMSRKKKMVVTMLPTHTTNITGLRTIVRGWSLRRLSRAAVFMMAESNSDRVAFAPTARSGRVARCEGRGAGSRIALVIPARPPPAAP
jgi:hypothetical protein